MYIVDDNALFSSLKFHLVKIFRSLGGQVQHYFQEPFLLNNPHSGIYSLLILNKKIIKIFAFIMRRDDMVFFFSSSLLLSFLSINPVNDKHSNDVNPENKIWMKFLANNTNSDYEGTKWDAQLTICVWTRGWTFTDLFIYWEIFK